MKKIIPTLIFTAAASAATLMYIKKKLSEKNEIELIELDEKQQLEKDEESDWQTNFDPFVEKVSEVTNTIDTIVDGFKEELSSESQLFDTVDETETPIEDSPAVIEIEEVAPIDDPIDEEEVETDKDTDTEIEEAENSEDDFKESEEPIINEDVVPVKIDEDLTETNEEEQIWIDGEPQVEEENTDQAIIPSQETIEEVSEQENEEPVEQQNESAETVVEEPVQEEIESAPIEKIEEIDFQNEVEAEQQRIADEIDNIINEIIESTEEEEEITEENVTYTPEEQQVNESHDPSNELEPLEYNEAPLEPLDEEKTTEVVINSIIDSVQEEDQNQQAMDDIEELVEDEVEQVDEEDMTHEELVEKYVHQFETINPRKIDMILTQIDLMRKTVGDCEYITLLHYIRFNSAENKDRYAAIAEVEGYTVEENEIATDLSLVNTLENDRHTLNWSILDLARNANEYNGAYRGWAVRGQE